MNRQSLWFDEIDVVIRAQRPLDQVLRTFVAAGENGPLYNVLLALWVRIAGVSEIAVRFPSAVAGALSIPVIYLLGRRLTGSSVGLVAAGLLAISPFHVWYSQEAKMYSLAVFLALASYYAFVEALASNRRLWWILYVVATSLLFYTHVVTVLVFVAQCLYAVLVRGHWHDRRRRWMLAVGALTLPYLPVALWAVRVVGGRVETWHPKVGLWDAVHLFGIRFAANRYDSNPAIAERAALLYVALAILGVAVLALRGRRERWWLLLLALTAVPVVGLWAFSLRQSVFSDRYGIVALPAYLILVAAAIVWLARQRITWPLAFVALFLLISFAWAPLRDVNRTHHAEKEDWRTAYAWIADRAGAEDVLLMEPGYMISIDEYFKQREPRLAPVKALALPSFRIDWFKKPDMIAFLQEGAGDATRFWLIQSPDRVVGEDPEAILEGWFQENGTQRDQLVVNGVRVLFFELEPGTLLNYREE